MTKGAILILGARSDIGLAIAHRFAADGHDVQLAARNADTLEADRTDIAVRHQVAATVHEFDALAPQTQDTFIDALPVLPEIVVCAVGLMGIQPESEKDRAAAARVIRSNFEGPANIFLAFAERFEQRGSGVLVGISSVAGERGRATNYIYGSAKAGFTAFLSGLRNRLTSKNVTVITVLPGFVATQMTEGLNLPQKLTAQPQDVANATSRAITRGKDVVYVLRFWWLIMLIIRNIPERIFKKMSI